MFDFFESYVARVWGSTLPNRLVWAIVIALVIELLVWLLSKRLRQAFGSVLARDVYLDATERVRRRKFIVGLPLLLLRAVLYGFALVIILRYLGFNTQAELVPLGTALLIVVAVIFWRVFKDASTGYFIMYDNLYAAGDRVTIGEHSGTVLEVGLRHTKLRGQDGREVAIANSTITQVVNHTRTADIERRAGKV